MIDKRNLLVISDTHGDTESIERLLNKDLQFDCIIHLGDFMSDARSIKTTKDVICIKGNGDFYSFCKEEKIIVINGKRIFLTHGHRYNIKQTCENLICKSAEINADLILFGHTHEMVLFEKEGRIFFNPGSLGRPRRTWETTYGLVTIDKDNISIKSHVLD